VATADALEAMLRDPVGAAALGEEGRQRAVQLLGPEHLVAEVAAVYDELVAGSR
jgi:glycosyltransferase involved in cell wall biosynthesis